MDFERKFTSYLNDAFRDINEPNIKGYCFNLFEPAGIKNIKFGLEIIGASEFNKNDSNWPCKEIWEPEQRQLMIPVSWSSEEYELCLERIKELINKKLKSQSFFVKNLKAAQGIGVGFVDGNLDVLWSNN